MILSQEQMKLVQEALKKAAIKNDVADEVMKTLASHGHGNEPKQGEGHGRDNDHGHGGGHGDDGGGYGHGGGHGHGDNAGPSQSYATIKGYCANFKTAMATLGTGIVSPDYQQEMMLVYMDRTKLNNVLAITPNDGYIAGIMGVYQNASSNQQVTISLLATNKDLSFVKDNSGNNLGGEQCWKEFNILQNFDSVFD